MVPFPCSFPFDLNVDADSDWEPSEGTCSEGTGSEKKTNFGLTLGGRGSFGMVGDLGRECSFGKMASLGTGSNFGPGETVEALRRLSEPLRASEVSSYVCLMACNES